MPSLALTLISSSMAPTITEGQTVWSTPCVSPCAGQIVVIPRGTIYVVHRLVLRFPAPFSRWGLERGDNEKFPRLVHLKKLAGVVIMPELGPSPTRRNPLGELWWWGRSMGGNLYYRMITRLPVIGAIHAGA
ncbi:S24/S26 family peptidase [Myxococcota bacterium]|nr:S24/S26 family peptidase [Myxococcota bacterium]MBU1535699.1 S24/S26 family peptidase [Myxococcota bacterium]